MRLSVYIVAIALSVVAAFTHFDDPLWQLERWIEMVQR